MLIYIACSLKFGRGVLECNYEFPTKCRAILTNPRVKIKYDPAVYNLATSCASCTTEEATYCGDVVTEFTYGGCHHSCKSCVETYVRYGVTLGPRFSRAADDKADY